MTRIDRLYRPERRLVIAPARRVLAGQARQLLRRPTAATAFPLLFTLGRVAGRWEATVTRRFPTHH
jgi:hypothetical protein